MSTTHEVLGRIRRGGIRIGQCFGNDSQRNMRGSLREGQREFVGGQTIIILVSLY